VSAVKEFIETLLSPCGGKIADTFFRLGHLSFVFRQERLPPEYSARSAQCAPDMSHMRARQPTKPKIDMDSTERKQQFDRRLSPLLHHAWGS